MNPIRFGAVVPIFMNRDTARDLVAPDNRVAINESNKITYVVTGMDDIHALDSLVRIRRQLIQKGKKNEAAEVNRSLAYFLRSRAYVGDKFNLSDTATDLKYDVLNEAGNPFMQP